MDYTTWYWVSKLNDINGPHYTTLGLQAQWNQETLVHDFRLSTFQTQ